MKKLTIYGPPGTGKTTRLMALLEKELRQVHAQSIAFVSFTKKGTYEGVNRAQSKFSLSQSDTRFFRTIHSLCFKALGMNSLDMINKEHYRLLSEKSGIKFTGYYTEDLNSTNDIFLHVLSMEKHNPVFAEQLKATLDMRKLELTRKHYTAMKAALRIYDFDDLLTMYLDTGKPLPVKVAFVDEAQDLTPLQWRVVNRLFADADKVIVAGDDDQAVFCWAGADVKKYLGFSKKYEILEKTYRLPNGVMDMSKRVLYDIMIRRLKKYESVKNAPEHAYSECVAGATSLSNVQLTGALLLSRTNFQLRSHLKPIVEQGMPYVYKGKPGHNSEVVDAIKAYRNKYKLPMTQQEEYWFDGFNGPWYANVKLPTSDVKYYMRMFDNRLYDTAPVRLETFHSSKGGESDHVILDTRISKHVYEHFHIDRDSELRCLYVAMTRAKEALTVLYHDDGYHYPYHYFN